jgi:hypothetical protein
MIIEKDFNLMKQLLMVVIEEVKFLEKSIISSVPKILELRKSRRKTFWCWRELEFVWNKPKKFLKNPGDKLRSNPVKKHIAKVEFRKITIFSFWLMFSKFCSDLIVRLL